MCVCVIYIKYRSRIKKNWGHSKCCLRFSKINSEEGQKVNIKGNHPFGVWVRRKVGYLTMTCMLSITVIASVKNVGYWICNVSLRTIHSKLEMCAFEFIYFTLIVALILNGCFQNIKGNGLLNIGQ